MAPKKTLKKSKFIIERSPNTDLNKLINNPNVTLFGEKCDQPFTAFYVWEKFLNEYKREVRRIIELGCDNGGMSTYFALWCHNIKADYHGFDRHGKAAYNNTPVKELIELDKKVKRRNIYSDDSVNKITGFIQRGGMTVIFADCIDKPWEFGTFAPVIKVGDVIVVHDWDRAIKDKWVAKTLTKIKPFKLLYEKERLELNTLTRFFLKE